MTEALCTRCEKPETLCVCAAIESQPSPVRVLILQHPQEPDKRLGTARIAAEVLQGAVLRVGLSWPNLRRALGETNEVDPKGWGVLYLGSQKLAEAFREQRRTLIAVSKKGQPLAEPEQAERIARLRGLVVLDGTWAQAKALWWRNAWLTKLQRYVIVPPRPSLYGNLRKEPRRESVSTLESIGIALEAITGDSRLREALERPFRALIERARAAKTSSPRS